MSTAPKINNVVLGGNVVADPIFIASQGKVARLTFSLAVDTYKRNLEGGYITDFFQVVIFGNMAQFYNGKIKKGQYVSVTGKLQSRRNESQKDGIVTRYETVEIKATEISYIPVSVNKQKTEDATTAANKEKEAKQTDDEIFKDGFIEIPPEILFEE